MAQAAFFFSKTNGCVSAVVFKPYHFGLLRQAPRCGSAPSASFRRYDSTITAPYIQSASPIFIVIVTTAQVHAMRAFGYYSTGWKLVNAAVQPLLCRKHQPFSFSLLCRKRTRENGRCPDEAAAAMRVDRRARSPPLFDFSLSAHQRRQLLDAFERKRRLRQRPQRDAHELHGIVVCCRPVG